MKGLFFILLTIPVLAFGQTIKFEQLPKAAGPGRTISTLPDGTQTFVVDNAVRTTDTAAMLAPYVGRKELRDTTNNLRDAIRALGTNAGNLYTTNGAFNSDRTVDFNGKTLTFTDNLQGNLYQNYDPTAPQIYTELYNPSGLGSANWTQTPGLYEVNVVNASNGSDGLYMTQRATPGEQRYDLSYRKGSVLSTFQMDDDGVTFYTQNAGEGKAIGLKLYSQTGEIGIDNIPTSVSSLDSIVVISGGKLKRIERSLVSGNFANYYNRTEIDNLLAAQQSGGGTAIDTSKYYTKAQANALFLTGIRGLPDSSGILHFRLNGTADTSVFVGGTGNQSSGDIANETDPTVGAHIKEITPTDIANWNTDAIGITTENDPTVPALVKNITQADIDRWNYDETGAGGGIADGNSYPTGIFHSLSGNQLTTTISFNDRPEIASNTITLPSSSTGNAGGEVVYPYQSVYTQPASYDIVKTGYIRIGSSSTTQNSILNFPNAGASEGKVIILQFEGNSGAYNWQTTNVAIAKNGTGYITTNWEPHTTYTLIASTNDWSIVSILK